MRYQVSLLIPASTSIATPASESLLLPHGVLDELEIYFPWGCAGLAHVRVVHNESQLYPTSPGEWFEGNDILIEFPCEYELLEAWNSFRVEGYNEDDFYPHTPIVGLTVLPARGSWASIPLHIGGI